MSACLLHNNKTTFLFAIRGANSSNLAYLGYMKFQGQALAKVNIGNVLDSCGKHADALEAFEEGYRQYLCTFLSNIIFK